MRNLNRILYSARIHRKLEFAALFAVSSVQTHTLSTLFDLLRDSEETTARITNSNKHTASAANLIKKE